MARSLSLPLSLSKNQTHSSCSLLPPFIAPLIHPISILRPSRRSVRIRHRRVAIALGPVNSEARGRRSPDSRPKIGTRLAPVCSRCVVLGPASWIWISDSWDRSARREAG
ncbi:hypothetical protein DY000_02057532 [Brassica cretica]|uniref:Uncharacterized protein n=1 Tax=Brassica cretica TaxID=69181 RepID=A0ABQ7AF62_BRACR|nr:hypothetical protein DY000_02057532 [Brassica cretica]